MLHPLPESSHRQVRLPHLLPPRAPPRTPAANQPDRSRQRPVSAARRDPASAPARSRPASLAAAAPAVPAPSAARSGARPASRPPARPATAPAPRPGPRGVRRPAAVVSMTCGRSTGTARTSARNWHSQSFAAMPPSTRSAAGAPPASSAIACEQVVRLVADGLQRGAHDVGARAVAGEAEDGAARVRVPAGGAQAGEGRHQVDAAASGRAAATVSDSAAAPIARSPSRSHCTAAPATKMLPSSA